MTLKGLITKLMKSLTKNRSIPQRERNFVARGTSPRKKQFGGYKRLAVFAARRA